MRRLVFLDEAENELLESLDHYDSERPGLGGEFLEEVRALTTRLLEFPESGPVTFRDVRRAGVRRFPFDIVYRVRPDALIVVAVMHQSRRPGYWKKRL